MLTTIPPLTSSIFPLNPMHYIQFEIFRFLPRFYRNNTSRSRIRLRVQSINEMIIGLWHTIARKVTARIRPLDSPFYPAVFSERLSCDVSETRAIILLRCALALLRCGFIGRHISEHFHDRTEVRVLDNLSCGLESNLSGLKCQLVVGSILDRDLVREAMTGVDFVFHLAAMVSVPGSVQKPNEYTETNAGGTTIVLEEAARAGAKKLIFSSSAAIYGDNPAVPQIESMSADPKNPYATSKYEGEGQCCSFTDKGRLPTVVLRYFNVFGPYQNPTSKYAAVVPSFIE